MSQRADDAAAAGRLRDVSRFVYGTTRLGDEKIPFDDRVRIARAAMDAGVWFHTSHQYGSALSVLRAAFDQDRSRVPRLIFKIGWDSIEQIRGQVREQLDALGLATMSIGQLCLGANLAREFRTGGPCYKGLRRLKDEGLVERFVLECWPWNSDVALDALRGGWPGDVVDGYIFYFNSLQRFVTNELWDLLRERDQPIIAMRTVAGGNVHRIAGNSSAPEYLRQRAKQVAPIFDRSGVTSWTEFAVRYIYGVPQVRTTVGSTARPENLQEFLTATRSDATLPQDIHDEIAALQRTWSDDHDRHAKPWSM